MSIQIGNFKDYLRSYAKLYQEKYQLPSDSLVTLDFQGNDSVFTVLYLETAVATEPYPINIGQYWFDGTTLRECITKDPSGLFYNTYAQITSLEGVFLTTVQLISEHIESGVVFVPVPEPTSTGGIIVHDGAENIDSYLPIGLEGYALVVDDSAETGLKWEQVLTLYGEQTLSSKTLESPVIDGFVSGTAILDEDDMLTDSPLKLATQQSIKAYIDNQIAEIQAEAESSSTGKTSQVPRVRSMFMHFAKQGARQR